MVGREGGTGIDRSLCSNMNKWHCVWGRKSSVVSKAGIFLGENLCPRVMGVQESGDRKGAF